MSIGELVCQSQQGNKEAMGELISLFNPLLIKYSRLANDEDAYNDLAADFIGAVKSKAIRSLINKDDFVYIAYLEKVVYHSYIRSRKKKRKALNTLPFSSLTEEALHKIDIDLSTKDDYFPFEIADFKDLLTKREYDILIMYLDNKPIAEIARIYGISRQAVNQTKLTATKKLKAVF